MEKLQEDPYQISNSEFRQASADINDDQTQPERPPWACTEK